MTLTFGSLFAGIGGFDLGFERAGMKCLWQVENDPYAQKVLAKHWPHVRRHGDVRTFPTEPATDWAVDVICGGFPCQDISSGGQKAGIDGERSGLWREFARIIRDLRPGVVVVENVADLAVRGMGRVLGDLASLGFDAEWDCLPASFAGLPHRRLRFFIVAYDSRWRRALFGQVFGRHLAKDAEREGHANAKRRGQAMRGSGGPLRCVPGFPLRRMADGIPGGLDGLAALGNAVCPPVAEYIGRQLMTAWRNSQ